MKDDIKKRIEAIKPVEDLLLELSSSITSSILRAQNSFVLSEAKKVEDTRIARRKRENKAKTEKAVHLLNSSCLVFNLIFISDLDIKMENARKRSLGMKERKAEKSQKQRNKEHSMTFSSEFLLTYSYLAKVRAFYTFNFEKLTFSLQNVLRPIMKIFAAVLLPL